VFRRHHGSQNIALHFTQSEPYVSADSIFRYNDLSLLLFYLNHKNPFRSVKSDRKKDHGYENAILDFVL